MHEFWNLQFEHWIAVQAKSFKPQRRGYLNFGNRLVLMIRSWPTPTTITTIASHGPEQRDE
jgi:hypothetical protein